MSWKTDRDALIAQTMAFVQSVTGQKEEPGRLGGPLAPPSPAAPDAAEHALTPAKPKSPAIEPVRVTAASSPLSAEIVGRSRAQGEMANEIRARIASFRAHQERFNREREEYFAATLARLRASIKDMPPATPER